MRQKTRNNKYFTFLIVLLVLISCDANRVFDTYTTLDNAVWKQDNALTFSFPIKDTINQHNLFINLRNNSNYEYSNLFIITKLKFPDQQSVIDTLEYDMADSSGKFLGTGFSEIKDNKLFYKENITFPISGNYTFEVSQAMRKSNEVEGIENLKGITDIGFRIEKTE